MNDLPKIPMYHVGRLIAEGGTAKVYWGIDYRSGYPVAIKELKSRHFRNPVVRRKFIAEVQLYLYMSHPNLVRLVDFINLEERELLYIVMEYIQGKTLEQYIYEEIGLIPEQKALPLFLDILDVVGYLHLQNILHLDIKSNNVMIQPDGKIKLIDLGIASKVGDYTTGFGTPAYMPPEQFEKRECGRYTDVFALGVMLFEMLTGTVPFTGQKPSEIQNKIKYEPTPSMNNFYPRINDELQAIVDKALAKEPYMRFQTCESFAGRIREYMHRHNLNG